jgi:hypothetical protein
MTEVQIKKILGFGFFDWWCMPPQLWMSLVFGTGVEEYPKSSTFK